MPQCQASSGGGGEASGGPGAGGGNDDPAYGALPRMPSGIEGLDTILLGGFIRNGLYIVQGAPGSGKTVFGNQICYAHMRAGGRALYITLLSEQHDRMLAYLSQFSFFDRARVAHEIHYISAFQLLERDGLQGLLTLIRREMVARGATLLVLDGLVVTENLAYPELALKKFIHELQILASAGRCTMFLLTSARNAIISPEHTMVDGMVEIGSEAFGWRTERSLSIRKLRGSDYLLGRHAMRISGDGIVVWPRTESLPRSAGPDGRSRPGRVQLGVPDLDHMLGGGLPRNSRTLLMGPSGSGKTTLGLHLLAGCTEEEPGLLLGFYESPEQVRERASHIGPDLRPHFAAGHVEMLWAPYPEDVMDRIASELFARVRRRGIRRLVIDGLLGFQDMTVQPERIPGFYHALSDELRHLGVTALYTLEVAELIGPTVRPPVSRLTPVAENLVLLRYVEQDARLKRLLSVQKLRDSAFDPRLREFEIGPRGVNLLGGFEGAQAVLTGFATPSRDPWVPLQTDPGGSAGGP